MWIYFLSSLLGREGAIDEPVVVEGRNGMQDEVTDLYFRSHCSWDERATAILVNQLGNVGRKQYLWQMELVMLHFPVVSIQVLCPKWYL